MASDLFSTLSPGERIVVRYRLAAAGPPAPGPALSDALGDFAGADDDAVRVRTRAGEVRIPRADITHAKRVPPAPERRRPRGPG